MNETELMLEHKWPAAFYSPRPGLSGRSKASAKNRSAGFYFQASTVCSRSSLAAARSSASTKRHTAIAASKSRSPLSKAFGLPLRTC